MGKGRETERRFLLAVPFLDVERAAVAAQTLRSRRLIQQRYLPSPGTWAFTLRLEPGADGLVRRVLVLRKAATRLRMLVSKDFADAFVAVARDIGPKKDDPEGTSRHRLADPKAWTVRVRRTSPVHGATARHFVTFKRKITNMSCDELESEIQATEHDQTVPFCGPALRKRRLRIAHGGRDWELDVFLNPELLGIEIAEVELPTETTALSLPPWAGREITEEPSYKNVQLERRIAR